MDIRAIGPLYRKSRRTRLTPHCCLSCGVFLKRNLGNNQLKGQIPGFTGSPKLQDVSLYGNQLSGGLPSPFAPELQVM